MPELPEVETIRRQIAPHLEGRSIRGFELLHRSYLRGMDTSAFHEKIVRKKISQVRRHGKALLIDIRKSGSKVIRLGMSGKILLRNPDEELLKHTHWRMKLTDYKRELQCVDPRRFGSLSWSEDGDVPGMGIDALQIGETQFCKAMSKRKVAVHTASMNQSILSGVGNIYACEALYAARLNPFLPACELTTEQCTGLIAALQDVLQKAIEVGGSSVSDYVDAEGDAGSFTIYHQVYGREGEICKRCASPIQRSRLGGRSVYYCAQCQGAGGRD